MKKHTANILTGLRLFCSPILLFLPVPSISFYTVYLFCGFTDMIDGTIARKTGSTSVFGSKFDTAADAVFMSVSLIRFLPIMNISTFFWIWISAIGLFKISNILYGFKKDCILPHTVMNKITGLLLFLLPFTLDFIAISLLFNCLAASTAAVQERFYIKRST